MSVVLAAAMKNFIIFMSDGRVTNNHVIIQENYKKLFRVNKDICIGYAGGTDICENVLMTLNGYDKTKLDLITTKNILYEHVKKAYAQKIFINKISMVIGGKSSIGNMELYAFESSNNFKIEHYVPEGITMTCAMLYSDRISDSDLLAKYLEINKPLNTFDKYFKAMNDCIDEVASYDYSVNKNKFTEIIV